MGNITTNEQIINAAVKALDDTVLAWNHDAAEWVPRPEGLINFLATKDEDKFILKNNTGHEYGELYLGQPYTPYECGQRIVGSGYMPVIETINPPPKDGQYLYGVTTLNGRQLGWMAIDAAMFHVERA